MRLKYFLTVFFLCLATSFAVASPPAHKHVYLIVFENHSYEDVVCSSAMPWAMDIARIPRNPEGN